MQLKSVMHMKTKRGKKESASDICEPNALQEPKNIAVKDLTYQGVRDDFTNSLMDHYENNRKIYPTFSIVNPLLLNRIRVNKRSKYI